MILSLILRIQRLKIHERVDDVLVSMLNLESHCSNSTASLVRFNDGLRNIALAVLNGS